MAVRSLQELLHDAQVGRADYDYKIAQEARSAAYEALYRFLELPRCKLCGKTVDPYAETTRAWYSPGLFTWDCGGHGGAS